MTKHAEIAARLAAALADKSDPYAWRDSPVDPADIAFLLDEITRLEAERDEANDEITDPWLCGIIRGLEWRASELQAEVATLREALHDAKHIVADPACEFCATPTATAREES